LYLRGGVVLFLAQHELLRQLMDQLLLQRRQEVRVVRAARLILGLLHGVHTSALYHPQEATHRLAKRDDVATTTCTHLRDKCTSEKE
jgi:hypothetical protein